MDFSTAATAEHYIHSTSIRYVPKIKLLHIRLTGNKVSPLTFIYMDMGYGHLPRVVKRVDIFVPLTGFNSRGNLGFT